MKIEDINSYILTIKLNQETSKYFWTVYINEDLLLKSTIEYDSERDCKIHLTSLHLGLRYLQKSDQLKF